MKKTLRKIAREKSTQAKSKSREASLTRQAAAKAPAIKAPGSPKGSRAKKSRSGAVKRDTQRGVRRAVRTERLKRKSR